MPLPKEAAVLRKFSWAARSLGTKEYTQDIHHDGGNVTDSVINARARAARATAARTTGGASYNDAFNKRVSSVKFCGKRLLTNFLPEITSPLEQEDALGIDCMSLGLCHSSTFTANYATPIQASERII